MLRVGLTGSIATGKTFVAGVLSELGCRVLDADDLARKVVEPGTPGLHALIETFGEWILKDDGTLDRAKLGAAVFGDAARLKILNAMLHPLIFKEQDEWLKRQEQEDPCGVAVVDAALMIESGGYRRFDKLIVVHCRPELQLARLMARNNLPRAEAEKRIASQMPQEEKLRYADFSIDTSGDFEGTRIKTAEVFAALQSLAKESC